ncbi:unnamed protein product [Nezara viridula]|uniref:Bromo domain-containing protein n=1 Tax=Nezara viridula TaxID=85310 RepID=A0A9P0MR79_NEZVI|nr:unnamed protein product [Nezara viridula]
MNDLVPKRKRGRPPKIPRDTTSLPIEFPSSHLAESNARQLQFGYKILQNILKLSKTKHLVDRPDENLFGIHNYYNIITKPIWLNEVLRKFSAQEYLFVHEVISDIRQVLENCYKFWGPKHKFSKQAFRIEKLLDKELQAAPQCIRDACKLNIPEDENVMSDSNSSPFFVDDFHSKILKLLEKKEKESVSETKECDDGKKELLLKWESEILVTKQYRKQFIFMGELAEIGHFLSLSREVLCLKEISQYEVERMLLFPKESASLANVMTALLCPSAMRGNLYFKPVMVYEVWSKILARKVDTWYNHYYKNSNKTQLFVRHGIESSFWEVVGGTNPLINSEFCLISFTKRVWIMKTLCTTMFHSYKKIEEYFNSVDDSSLRGPVVYEDGKFEYIGLFQPEIRVYRICRSEMDIDGRGEFVAIVPMKNGLPPELVGQTQVTLKSLGKKNKFYLAAYDRESLEGLIKVFSQKKKSLSAMKRLLANENNEFVKISALTSMKQQWEKNKERSPIVINNSVKYWIEKDLSPPLSPGETSQNHLILNNEKIPNDLSCLGKRVLKKKFFLDDWENSSDSSIEFNAEEDASDWEEGNIRRSKRKKCRWSKWQRDEFPPFPSFSTPRPLSQPPIPLVSPKMDKPLMIAPVLPNPGMRTPPHNLLPLMLRQQPIFSQQPVVRSPFVPPVSTYRSFRASLPLSRAPSYSPRGFGGVKLIKSIVRRPNIVTAAIANAETQKAEEQVGKVLTINLGGGEEKAVPVIITPMRKVGTVQSPDGLSCLTLNNQAPGTQV